MNKFRSSNTEKIGAYGMFNNKNFDHENLARGIYKSCKKNQGYKHLLCLQDTTQINFHYNINRIGKDNIGSVANKNAGVFCHPMLVVEPDHSIPIGISSIKLWNRAWNRKSKNERKYKSQPVTEKESYRWIESALYTKELLSDTPTLTVIGDRESDIYEEFVLVPDERTHLLVRSSVNRKLLDSDEKFFETLAASDEQGTYKIEIKGNKKRKIRVAKMAFRFKKIKIKKPNNSSLKDYPDNVEMWAIETSVKSSMILAPPSFVLFRFSLL